MANNKKIELKLEIDDNVAQGVYSNLALITHSEQEFIIDFIYVQPQEPKGRVRARVILTPQHTKKFLQALTDNVSMYEEKFGSIKIIQEVQIDRKFLA